MSNLYDGHDSIIYSDAIDARINELDALYAHAEDSTEWEDNHADEYAELKRFRDDVQATLCTSAWTESSGFIADTYFAKYADDRAADLYGREVVDLPYWDQDAFENDQRYGFTEFAFDGVTYLVDKDW